MFRLSQRDQNFKDSHVVTENYDVSTIIQTLTFIATKDKKLPPEFKQTL